MDRCAQASEVQKQSCGDLQSRLKARKLLGVGTTEDGDVHRSKLSQILGHSEQLHIRIPRGLRPWQWILTISFLFIGMSAVVFPGLTFGTILGITFVDQCSMIPARLFGATLLGLSATNWASTDSIDKDVVRWSMISNFAYFLVQLGILVVTLYGGSNINTVVGATLILCHISAIIIDGYFYWAMGIRHHAFRPRTSVDIKGTRVLSSLANTDNWKDS